MSEARNTKTQLMKDILDCKMKLAAENASSTLVQKILNAQKFGTEKVLEAQERKASQPVSTTCKQNVNE